MEHKFIIKGKPTAKARPRFFRRGNFVGTYSDQETEEGRFMWEVNEQWPYQVPIEKGITISLRCIFYMPIPKSTSKKKRLAMVYHTNKPDIDNLCKFLMDCFNGIVWADDAQVAELAAGKLYSEDPRTEIIVREVE